jgi:hypothetical protein
MALVRPQLHLAAPYMVVVVAVVDLASSVLFAVYENKN